MIAGDHSGTKRAKKDQKASIGWTKGGQFRLSCPPPSASTYQFLDKGSPKLCKKPLGGSEPAVKLSELRQWRPVKDDEYLKVTRDHLQITGWNKGAAVVYAVPEFKAHPGGKGDVHFMNMKMPQFIKLMGGYKMNAETTRAGIRFSLQTEVALEGPRGEDNTWNLRINRERVQYILSMSKAKQNRGLRKFAKQPRLPSEPANPIIARRWTELLQLS